MSSTKPDLPPDEPVTSHDALVAVLILVGFAILLAWAYPDLVRWMGR